LDGVASSGARGLSAAGPGPTFAKGMVVWE
jgi:hypothetical protein